MGKPSAQVLLMQARKEIQQLQTDLKYSKGFTIQQCMDVAMIALNLEFQFGPVYNRRFERRFRDVFVELSSLCVDDGETDEELVYTKDYMDRALRAARGDNVLPFDERYALDRMYFRDSMDEWKEEGQHETAE